jgi:hypothetical protein
LVDDTLKMITDREAELAPLYTRMDQDSDFARLKKYTLTGFDMYRDREIPRTISVTMNEPAVFADAIISVLQGAKRQTTVEGLSDSHNRRIETFLDDVFYTADQRLQKRRISGLWAWVCNHIAIRGPVGARWTFDLDGMPNCLPVDMRYCPFDLDADGRGWVANHTTRTVRAVLAEYPQARGLPPDGNVNIYDYWDADVNRVFVGTGVQIHEQKNPYGFPPFAIQFPSTGFMLLDEGYLQHEAESIFFMVRDLYPEWNRLMSIQQTRALEIVRPPYVHQVKEPGGQPQPYPHQIGTNMEVGEGEVPVLLQSQDMSQMFEGAAAGMAVAIHKGSVNITDMADVSGMRNAAWVTEQTLIRDRILAPRTQALEMFYRQLAQIIIREARVSNLRGARLGRAAVGRRYSAADLTDPDDYTIDFRYMPDNPRQKLANYSVGIALKGILSDDTIIRDILQVDDPDGEVDKLRSEEARRSNPVIFYYEMAASLIDQSNKKTGDDATRKRLLKQARMAGDAMVEEIKRRKLQSVDQPARKPNTLEPSKGSSHALPAMPGVMGGNTGGNGQQAKPVRGTNG